MNLEMMLETLASNGDFTATHALIQLSRTETSHQDKEAILKELNIDGQVSDELKSLTPLAGYKTDYLLGQALVYYMLNNMSHQSGANNILKRIQTFENQLRSYFAAEGTDALAAHIYRNAAEAFSSCDDNPICDLITVFNTEIMHQLRKKHKRSSTVQEPVMECTKEAYSMLFGLNYAEDEFERYAPIVDSWLTVKAPSEWLEYFVKQMNSTVDAFEDEDRTEDRPEIVESLTARLNKLSKMYDPKSVSAAFHHEYKEYTGLIRKLRSENVICKKPREEPVYDRLLREYQETPDEETQKSKLTFDLVKELEHGSARRRREFTQIFIDWFTSDEERLVKPFLNMSSIELPPFFDKDLIVERMTAYFAEAVADELQFTISECFSLPKHFYDLENPALKEIRAAYSLREACLSKYRTQ